jgi:hypothetical protein
MGPTGASSMAGKQGNHDSLRALSDAYTTVEERCANMQSYQSHRSPVCVFGDQVCDPRHDAERRHVVLFFHTVWHEEHWADDPTGLVALALGKHGITVNAYAPGGVETRLR